MNNFFYSLLQQLVVFILVFALSASFYSVQAQEQVGRPLITNYSYQEYEAAPINWNAIEDVNGIMYFANIAGVLQFDGVNWKLIEIPGIGTRSLAKDEKGTIYVGGSGELGYLSTSSNGEITYVSLLDKIPEEHKPFADVWEIDFYRGRIIFRTEFKLFCWDGKTIKVVTSENGLHVGGVIKGTYYQRIWDVGLCTLKDDDTFELVPNGEKFSSERIYTILPYDDKLLIGTRNEGFYIYDGKDFTPFKTEIDEFVKGSLYLPGVALNDGRYVFNTNSDGAYLIDKKGKLLQRYAPSNGLGDGAVNHTYIDSRGVLWMSLFKGLSSTNLNSSLTFLDADVGVTSVVYTVYRHNGVLYFSTNNGISYLDETTNRVKPIEGTFGQGNNFFEFKNRLYNGSNGMGFIEIKDKTFEYVRKNINYDFRSNISTQSKIDSNRIFIGHQQGLMSLYFNEAKNQFEEESNINTVIPNSSIRETNDGNLWFDTRSDSEVFKIIPEYIDGKLDLNKSEMIRYGLDDGLPESNIGIILDDDNQLGVFASTVEKTYVFDKDSNRFKEEKFWFDTYINWENPGSRTQRTADGKVWFNAGSGIMVAEKNSNGEYEVNTDVFKELQKTQIYTIYPEDPKEDGSRVVWLSGPDGVFRYEGKLNKPDIPDFHVDVRSFSIGGDSLVYEGNIDFPKDLKITFDKNTVNIGYAAPLYIGQKEIQYRTQLMGLDDKWSEWGSQTSREYINLPAGSYEFKVKAKNVYGDVSEEALVSFAIVPPWYKMWWAYALYALGILGFIYFSVKARTKILLNQQKVLEDTVEERTAQANQRLTELATVNEVSKALNDKLELDELIQLVGNQMKDVFKSDITYLAVLDEKANMINFPYQDGDDMPPFKLGEGLTSKIIQTGEPLLINKDTDIAAEYSKSGIEQTGKQAISYLGVPIPVENTVIGVLSVQSTEQESRFNDNDKKLLNTIAINVGVALHNAELYEEAKIAKAKAEDANEAKSAFLSTVSHELRTPLTSVLGFAKIIRKRLEDKIFPAVTVEDQKIKRTMKQVSENLNVVVSEGERLTTLINDVLDLAKIESGRMEWNLKPVFLQDVISRAVSATSSLFEQKSLSLKKNVPENLPLISGDEDKLIQVVINLLSNSVKFTDKGSVSIEAYEDKGQLIVEVQDTGIGIAEEDKHKIFERFRQAGDTLTDKPQGTGLGLPICREIIEHHGGIIWMNSEPNVGSTFFVSIPTIGDNKEQPIELERILKSLKKQIKHSSHKTLEDVPTILVVDDDTPIRSLLRQELTDAGYQVKEAANGKAALDMVRIAKPDLIILDVMMPEINGFDVAAVLKNDPATMDIPIIILSIVQDKERGFRIGVDRYLTKPIDTEKLFHEVEDLLEQGVSKKRVLVVDEDASAVKSLTDVLTARGYKVMEANPDNLLETASEIKPDIIMLNSIHKQDENTIKKLKFQKGMENVMFFVYQ
ncbi:ATP-binding protein [Croceitalea rosinachiae]|uniref:histidine kinase n=1 Tax=Croceitalea rosinachiae TaxID=3075596 RepID=A0ABU3ADY2_9FLAO|nr:ATP-binding protein [Croceitalea sp. F388]MDT0607096.1 response regulator [Croceitalea sp. F388]